MFRVLLPARQLAQDVSEYIVTEFAFTSERFLRPNVLCFLIGNDAVSIDGKPPPGKILGNSFASLPQEYEKRDGTVILVQFLGGAWSRLLGIDPAMFERIMPLGDEHCEGLEALHADLREADGDYIRIAAVLDSFLLMQLGTASPRGLPERVRAEIGKVIDCPIAEIAKSLGVSERTIQRSFRARFGVSPSRFKRYVRLLRSQDQGSGLKISWLNVPPELNYADQSHWIKEFKKLQGITPSEYTRLSMGDWHYHSRGEAEARSIDDPQLREQWREYWLAGQADHDLALTNF